MKIASINIVTNGSTGKIMLQIAIVARATGYDARTYAPIPYYKKSKQWMIPDIPGHTFYGTRSEAMFHNYLGKLFGLNGMLSASGTKQLVRELEDFNPDVLHLHNLHKYCINFPLLFDYIKHSGVKVVWTLHDCWTFTGHCPCFVMAGCDKWKTGCHHCPQLSVYPKSFVDDSKRMWNNKKKWFTGIENMTLVTPSRWLADLVRESYLSEYPVKVIHNGIDLSVFKPMESNFREKYNCEDKIILLGVAFDWGRRKGLDVFIELSQRLPEKYRIVLVGTNDKVDKQLPENIISIHKTNNQQELAEIYSAADLFVNPTREDNYPTVNMESIACGTPVLTFRTGGSPEIVDDTCGFVVDCDDVDSMEKEIIRITTEKPFTKEMCVERARLFDMNEKFKEYIKLYEDITHRT